MARLTMLKPRIKALDVQRVPTLIAGSWRTSDMGSTARGYGYKWQQARERFLRAHPLCVMCEKQERRVTAATVVDHIIPHRGDKALFWSQSNWQPLCAHHHSSDAQKKDNRLK